MSSTSVIPKKIKIDRAAIIAFAEGKLNVTVDQQIVTLLTARPHLVEKLEKEIGVRLRERILAVQRVTDNGDGKVLPTNNKCTVARERQNGRVRSKSIVVHSAMLTTQSNQVHRSRCLDDSSDADNLISKKMPDEVAATIPQAMTFDIESLMAKPSKSKRSKPSQHSSTVRSLARPFFTFLLLSLL